MSAIFGFSILFLCVLVKVSRAGRAVQKAQIVSVSDFY